MLEGSCACGAIRYAIDGELVGPIGHCHCWQCRKHSGASFGTTVAVRVADFRIVAGDDRVATWTSSPGVHRHFASCCGTPIFKTVEALPDFLGLRIGTLDVDPGRRVEQEIFVDSKAPWIELDERLRHEPGGLPFPQLDRIAAEETAR